MNEPEADQKRDEFGVENRQSNEQAAGSISHNILWSREEASAKYFILPNEANKFFVINSLQFGFVKAKAYYTPTLQHNRLVKKELCLERPFFPAAFKAKGLKPIP